ncbi:MAG: hypothetical protein FK733_19070 [Asgard group archaeon]|nr:hypothetical protein [Asgard group archaeon]
MSLRKRKIKAIILLVGLFGVIPFVNTSIAEEVTIDPVFYISVLAPNTCGGRSFFPQAMVDIWPEIGIGIDIFDNTGWAQISPRTWGYPGPYPIPPYEDGGFDVLFVGWSWGLDWDPTGLYDSPSITPVEDNFYQFNNTDMDWAIFNYTSSYELDDRLFWANEIQQILYEELPQHTIIYPLSLYAHDKDLSDWDDLLWPSTYQPMENWTIPGQTEFHYAVPADFEDFHIYKYESVYDAQWLRQIYNGLFERSANNHYAYAPRLATDYSTNDYMNYTVNIDPDAVWADGTPLNTSDVEFSYKLQITPAFGNPDFGYWSQYLRNNSVTIIDEHTFQISFNKTYVFQEGNLALDLVPKHIWKDIPFDQMEIQANSWASSDPSKIFGAGPYKLHTYDGINEIIRLTRNDNFANWSDVTPYFDDIYFEFYSNKEEALLALASGTIDMVDAQFSTQISEIPAGVGYTKSDEPGTQEIAINMQHPILGTGALCPIAGPQSAKYVRKAIAHSIPREYFCNELLDGLARPGVTGCPSVAVGFNETLEPYAYNQTLSREYLRMAGYDIPTITPSSSPTISIGLGLPIILGILALVSSTIYLSKRIKD